MNLYTAAWKQGNVFNGKSTRPEYWTFILVNMAISLALSAISPHVQITWGIITLVPTLSLTSRRLFDAGQSNYWLLLPVIFPLIAVILVNLEYPPNPNYEMMAGLLYILTFAAILLFGLLPTKHSEPETPKE